MEVAIPAGMTADTVMRRLAAFSRPGGEEMVVANIQAAAARSGRSFLQKVEIKRAGAPVVEGPLEFG